MTNEIKEILDKLKEEIDLKPLWYSERIKLLDYITNLQEKYEEADKLYSKMIYEYNRVLSRIDKAIEWCDEIIRTYYENDNQVVLAKEIKNILQGEDKELKDKQ